jgi:hypothetical protein
MLSNQQPTSFVHKCRGMRNERKDGMTELPTSNQNAASALVSKIHFRCGILKYPQADSGRDAGDIDLVEPTQRFYHCD